MTVIACRDGVIAADTAQWHGDLKIGTVDKVLRSRFGVVFACAGSVAAISMFETWVLCGFPEGGRPVIGPDDAFGALMLHPDMPGIYRFYCNDPPYKIAGEWAVEGCHEEFLHGALAAGASAPEAIALAICYCRVAGGTVTSMRLRADEG